jgi:hypothetical protein
MGSVVKCKREFSVVKCKREFFLNIFYISLRSPCKCKKICWRVGECASAGVLSGASVVTRQMRYDSYEKKKWCVVV